MSVIMIPRKPLRLPQGRLVVDDASLFAQGLRLAYVAGMGVNIASGSIFTPRGNGVKSTPSALGLAAESISAGGLKTPVTLQNISAPISIFVFADRGPSEPDTRSSKLIDTRNAADGFDRNVIWFEEGGAFGSARIYFRNASGNSVEVSSAVNGASNTPTGYGAVVAPTFLRAYCGQQIGGYATHSLDTTFLAEQAYVFGDGALSAAWPGRIYAAYIWQGFDLTPDLFKALQSDYLLPLKRDPIRIYSLPSGPISISWSSLTASNITQTGATLTLGGIVR